jgi:hypothetical protein
VLTAELLAHADELADGHVLGPLLGLTGTVEDFPCRSKIVMEIVHVFSHSVVLAELGRCKFG